MTNNFISFIKPYLEFIDKGILYQKAMLWIYTYLGIANLITPLIAMYFAFDMSSDASGKVKFTLLLCWAVLAFACWLNFQIWWDRKSKIPVIINRDDEFVISPVFAHFVQTAGEAIGSFVGITLTLIPLIVNIFLENSIDDFLFLVIPTNLIYVIVGPLLGCLITIIFRFYAEQIKAITSIANNTKKN